MKYLHIDVTVLYLYRYMHNVITCSYSSGNFLQKWNSSLLHEFPVKVISDGGEELVSKSSIGQESQLYDTLISINVLEHVQDAFAYLTNLYTALRPGGLLIWHERYYDDHSVLNGDRFHPVRVKKVIFDHFLSGFNILFNNCSASYDGRKDEKGYYVIAVKK
jgi:hypothetical protein